MCLPRRAILFQIHTYAALSELALGAKTFQHAGGLDRGRFAGILIYEASMRHWSCVVQLADFKLEDSTRRQGRIATSQRHFSLAAGEVWILPYDRLS